MQKFYFDDMVNELQKGLKAVILRKEFYKAKSLFDELFISEFYQKQGFLDLSDEERFYFVKKDEI